LFVRAVQYGSPAFHAGARVGDRLIAINGEPIADMATARRLLRDLQSKPRLHFAVVRAGETLDLTGEIRPLPLEQHAGGTVLLDEVTVDSHRLRAIVLVPDSPGPHPTLYYLPGAHWASEEYPFDTNSPVPTLLGHLARHGIASLRIERFGMGDSEGPPCTEVDFDREVAGYRAGLELLQTAPWCDRRVFFWGHSLGAMVAPLLAAELPSGVDLRGVITFGASAMPISRGLTAALHRYGERQPHIPTATIVRQAELLRLIVEHGRTPAQALRERPDLADVAPEHFTDTSIYRRNVAFYHQLEAQPVATAWTRVHAPVVALHGANDWICSFEDSQRVAALAPRGSALSVPGTDHHLSNNNVTFLRDPQDRPASLTLSSELATAVVRQLAHWASGSTQISHDP